MEPVTLLVLLILFDDQCPSGIVHKFRRVFMSHTCATS